MSSNFDVDFGGAHHRANLASTLLGFFVSTVLGLWFTPYLLRNLGAAAYGLIPLATIVVSYFSLLSQSLNAALSRSLALALGQGDRERVNHVFGTALSASAILCGVLLLPLSVVAILSPKLFEIPRGMRMETQVLFGVVGINFLASLMTTSFSAVSFSVNRIYLNNISSILQTSFRIIFTVGLFFASAPKVLYAAMAILISGVISLCSSIVFAKVSVPWLNLSGLKYDRADFFGFFRTSTHQLIMQLGTVIIMSCEIVLVNRLFGHHESGRYAAVIQWLFLLRNATTSLVVLFVPSILSRYAQNDLLEMVRFTKRAMRCVGVCVALGVGYLSGLAPEILSVWLGPEFRDLWIVMCVQLGPLVVISSVVPLYTISLASDRVLTSGMVQVFAGIIAILLTFTVVHLTGAGMVAVAACVGGTLLLKELLFMPIFAARNIGQKFTTFYVPLLQIIPLFILALAMSWLVGRVVVIDHFVELAAAGVLVSIPYFSIALVTIPSEDRKVILQQVLAVSGLLKKSPLGGR